MTPGKYLVFDESMNQCLGIGMANLNDPRPEEYDSDESMRKLTATMKRLVKPWFSTGRTDSIMQVAKRRYWPRSMPTTDVVEHTDIEPGSFFTMKNQQRGMFVTSFRHLKVKAFISSCGTTRLSGSCAVEPKGKIKQFARPAAIDGYEKHKSLVDAANNLRDNMICYHDVISSEQWERRFFDFFLGMCEANAFAEFTAYHVFLKKVQIRHSSFKNTLAWGLLHYGQKLETVHYNVSMLDRVLRSNPRHRTSPLTTLKTRNARDVCAPVAKKKVELANIPKNMKKLARVTSTSSFVMSVS
ncbi:hypothetical protein [Parasitella parasitica]|uniref:PiggyBac transposable element-derived protein domain-containing protein n=1 Tax=Parasitella parasitica TaxID=35722 RepID=A0A0B7NM32_9FUNG|nr:hypothetical protein [Parasitella parasitica]